MTTITVAWRRVVQVKPYESLEFQLGMTDTLDRDPIMPSDTTQAVAARGAQVAKIEADLYRQLAHVGNALVAEQLAKLK